jgi:hypothetical protein
MTPLNEASDVLTSLYGYLKITYEIIAKAGPEINVSENFTVRFTVTNVSPSSNVLFRNPIIYVKGTTYAHPVAAAEVSKTLRQVLGNGQSDVFEIGMVADKVLTLPFHWPEAVANVSVRETLDMDRLSRVYSSIIAYTQIEP